MLSRFRVRWSLVAVFFAGVVALGAPPVRPIPAVEHVVLISIDGARPDCVLLADMPTVHRMIREGAYTMWAKTTAISITLPSHVSMLTGVTPNRHGILWNWAIPLREPVYPAVPTVFELARQAGYVTAMAAGKEKFSALNKPGTLSRVFVPATGTDVVSDERVVDEAVKMIVESRPALLFVHLPDDDTVGHAKGWASPEQFAALAKTDREIARLLDALDRAGIRSSTVVLVTSDHGGAGRTHGPDDARSRHIPWIVTGPGVKHGYDLTRRAALDVHTEDTFATACYLLGVQVPAGSDGQPVLDAFEDQK